NSHLFLTVNRKQASNFYKPPERCRPRKGPNQEPEIPFGEKAASLLWQARPPRGGEPRGSPRAPRPRAAGEPRRGAGGAVGTVPRGRQARLTRPAFLGNPPKPRSAQQQGFR